MCSNQSRWQFGNFQMRAGCKQMSANEVWGKVIFLHLSVILFMGRGVPGQVPPGTRYTPLRPGTPPETRYTPRDQVHLSWDQVHPHQVHPPGIPWDIPPSSACWEIRATHERYASYWNAFLFEPSFC